MNKKMKKPKMNNEIKIGGLARLDTNTLINSTNTLSEVAYKTLLFIISRIDHNKDLSRDLSVDIPFPEFINGIGNFGISWKKSKSSFNDFISKLSTSQFQFLTDVKLEGVQLAGNVNLFSSIIPTIKDNNQFYTFKFTNEILPVISNLKSFTRLYSKDVSSLKGSYTLDLYTYFSALSGRESKFKNRVTKKISKEKLRERLGIKDKKKFSKISLFKRDVLDYAINQINEYTPIYVWYNNLKEGRNVTGFEFFIISNSNYIEITNKKNTHKKEIESLLWYDYQAYLLLKDFGVKEGIILKQFIPKLPKGYLQGREDMFIKFAIEYFIKNTKMKTKQGKVGAFVNWFCKKDVYLNEESNVFISIREKVIEYSKTLAKKDSNYFVKWSEQKNKTYGDIFGKSTEIEFPEN